jgi:glutathione-regulated potassium-efflux system protein KefB
VETSLKIVELARREFPHLEILARARNRRHAHLIMDYDVPASRIVRETLHSSLVLTGLVLDELGVPGEEVRRTIDTFREHDEQTLAIQHAIYNDEKQIIQSSRQRSDELMSLFEADRQER